ncbi:conserved Plasmodium protein, unknown function [Plasmodium vinckei brucechwatti]|uniref:tRNA 4-demethylwyosine synthase (AdoMet-dependent) n=1 Tax=Plasmodium vinckei brucechwatti TaxID=119398 RepID=A0A6V7SMC0_PLAVN|nr:conserved Plasmodium protein, unknown function [Plasmodium vinckei brucechwatti]
MVTKREDELVPPPNEGGNINIYSIQKKTKINLTLIYGSEGITSYKAAKEFLNELIVFFNDIPNHFNTISTITKGDKKNNTIFDGSISNEINNIEDYMLEYFQSKLLKTNKKNKDRKYGKSCKNEKENIINNESSKCDNEVKDIFDNLKNYEKNMIKCGNTHFNNYLNCSIENNISEINFDFVNGNEFDSYTFFENSENNDLNILFMFISTYNFGSFPANCYKLEDTLTDLVNDFRVEKNYLKNIFYSCVGFGNKEYGSKYFCIPIKKCDKFLSSLGANKLEKTLKLCSTMDNEEEFVHWKSSLLKNICLSLFLYNYNYTKFSNNFFHYANRKNYNTLKYYCTYFCKKSDDSKSMPINDGENKQTNKPIDNNNINKCDCINNGMPSEHLNTLKESGNDHNKLTNKTNGHISFLASKIDACNTEKCGCTSNNCLNGNDKYINEKKIINNNFETSIENGCCKNEYEQDDELVNSDFSNESMSENNGEINCNSSEDLEDLLSNKIKDMLTDNQRTKLTKEGYKIIGSHSAVKLCRWTKSQIRGRGGCYKHTFYGINSYQCMEATPSLACANKCVFCWRHHKNPVGTKWRWNKDEADFIVDEAVKKHKNMIKELKGVHNVINERFENAKNIRHCALSLVGEPIMYPDINKLIDELHKKNISTFLVTNAQFPNELKKLKKVTQLYISIDAPNKEALKNIDRPLFKDYWDRYLKCIKILKEKKERTVFRFTLVKEYNMMSDEISSYAKLIEYGYPDFIEIKAVTYCGSSEGYQLTMKNIPWHEEVYQFAFHLVNSKRSISDIYEISCEHKHSCSILIAKKIFKINNKWHTWINYEKFQSLVKQNVNFTAIDYCAETPEWAVVGAPECGFNPSDQRVYTKGKNKKKNNINTMEVKT